MRHQLASIYGYIVARSIRSQSYGIIFLCGERVSWLNTFASQAGPIPLRLADGYSLRPRIISIYYPTPCPGGPLGPTTSGPSFFLLFHPFSDPSKGRDTRDLWRCVYYNSPARYIVLNALSPAFRCFAIATVTPVARDQSLLNETEAIRWSLGFWLTLFWSLIAK